MADLVMKDKEKMTADYKESVPMRFCQLICENYVQFFTGLENTRIFQTLFNYLQKKAFAMACWDGTKTRYKKASLLASKNFCLFY